MVFQKTARLVFLFLLALVCAAITFQIFQISKTEKLYPMSVLQKGYEIKTENLYPIQFYMRGGRSGYAYVNQAAQLVVEPQFYEAGKFSEGFAPVKINKKWGFINLKGLLSIAPQYDKVGESSSPYINNDYDFLSTSFSEGLAGVKFKGKWGFINQSGELVIPYQFDKVQRFSSGVATVQVNGLWGVINPEGKWIIQPVNESPIRFFQGIATLQNPNTYQVTSYLDKSGRLVGNFNNPPKLAEEFQEELAIIGTRLWAKWQGRDVPPVVATSEYKFGSSGLSKCGFQDQQGKVIIKPQFDGCQSFSSGLAAVRVAEKWGYIDKTGKLIVSPQFDYADRLVEERGLVVSNGKIGFIDQTGLIVIKPEFEPSLSNSSLDQKELLNITFKKYVQQLDPSLSEVMRHRFSHGLAAVALDDKCGYIDKIGKFVIQPQFAGCEQFDSHGVAEVSQRLVGRKGFSNSEVFYINSEGKTFPQMITPASFSNFYPARIKLLTSVMACLLWIVAISCHEFGHAIVAYWGGDRSVKDKGYLSFNPRRYIHPLHSIILPAIFLVTGGIPLPGAAVYIEFNEIRNRWWSSATAAAGPLISILFGLLLVPVFHFSQAWNFPHWFSAFIAVFINLQFVIALFNLLPIPPLDGYRIFSVWLPPKLQDRNGIVSIIGLFFICFLLPFIPIAALLFIVSAAVMLALGISEEFSLGGWYLLERWYTALPLLFAGLVYLIYKPASIILQRIGTIGDCLETISACEQAIQLDPLNHYDLENSGQLSQSWECIQTITNYSHSVAQVAFSPDGKMLASSKGEGNSGCVKLWNVASGTEIHTFSEDHVMAFSQDGQTLVGRNYFWDVATGRTINQVAANFVSHWNVAISPDLQAVASYQRFDRPDVTKLWETATGREICSLPPIGTCFYPEQHYRLTKFSPDGRIFAKAIKIFAKEINDRQEVKLWEVATGREICTIATKDFTCTCLTFSPDGQILASAWVTSKNRFHILLSEVATGKQLCLIKIKSIKSQVLGSIAYSVAFSPNGQILASGNRMGQITFWQLGSSWLQPLTVKKKRIFSSGYAGNVESIAFNPNGQTLASSVGYDNSGITLWDVKSGRTIQTIPGHPEEVYCIIISPDGQTVAQYNKYKLMGDTIKLWRTQSGAFMRCLQSRSYIKAVAFSQNGTFLICVATILSELFVTIWEVATGRAIHNINHKIDAATGNFGADILGLSEDGVILVIRHQNGTLKLLESRTAQTICTINANGALRVAFSRDRQFLAVIYCNKHTIDICAVETGKLSRTINTHPQEYPQEIVFSPDGQLLAIKDENFITLWNVSSGVKLHTFNCDYWDYDPFSLADYDPFSLAFSSDGQILASPTTKATIKLWDVATGDEICTLPGHPSSRWDNRGGFSSSSIAFSRYGLVLVSGGEDGTIKVWQQKRSDSNSI